jgi:hypothetical protein
MNVTTVGLRWWNARGRRAVAGGLAAVTAACGGAADSSAGAASVARDSAGVRVVDNLRSEWGEDEGWVVGEPQLTIGGDPDDDLFSVADAIVLPDGRVAVAVAGTSEVRIYRRDGSLEHAWGGPGDGPEEFRLMARMGRAGGDTLWVHDYGHSRITWLSPDDGFLGALTLAPPLSAGMVTGRRSDGSFVLGQMWGTPPAGTTLSEGLARDPAAYVAYGPDGTPRDTLTLEPGREVMHRLEGERMTMGSVPFAHRASDALLGDDLVVGDQITRSFHIQGLGGTASVVRWTGPSLEIGDDEVREWINQAVADAPEAERTSVRAWYTDLPTPDTKPAYGRFLPDTTGALWVAEYAARGEPTRWDVFDPQGRWRGPVAMPAGFRLLEIGTDEVVGVVRDDLDVERVEVRALLRGGR